MFAFACAHLPCWVHLVRLAHLGLGAPVISSFSSSLMCIGPNETCLLVLVHWGQGDVFILACDSIVHVGIIFSLNWNCPLAFPCLPMLPVPWFIAAMLTVTIYRAHLHCGTRYCLISSILAGGGAWGHWGKLHLCCQSARSRSFLHSRGHVLYSVPLRPRRNVKPWHCSQVSLLWGLGC